MEQYINLQVLDGNLSNETDPTREQVDDYVDMLREVLCEDYPDAKIEIDLLRGVSGYRRPTEAHSDDVARDTDETANRVWVAWCEKHLIA